MRAATEEIFVERIVVKANDVELECFSVGAGTPIVLLPGGSLTVDYLSGLADAIAAAGSRAISVNFRGAGDSVGPMRASRCTTTRRTLRA